MRKILANSFYGIYSRSGGFRLPKNFYRKTSIDKIFKRVDGRLLGGESILYDSSIVVKMKSVPLRCRWRKISINKIYAI